MSATSYLDRFLDPVTDAFTPELADVIVNLRADAETEARINVLRQNANERMRGTITSRCREAKSSASLPQAARPSACST